MVLSKGSSISASNISSEYKLSSSFPSTSIHLSQPSIPNGVVLKVDTSDIISSTGSTVASLGGFSQSTSSQCPTYSTVGGFNNLPYLSFNSPSSQHLVNSSATFNIASNGGFTAIALVRFNGTPGSFERIFDFGNGQANNNIILARGTLGGSGTTGQLVFSLRNGTTSYEFNSTTSPIVQNEWSIFGCRYNGSTRLAEIFKNGISIANTTFGAEIINRTTTINYIGRSNWPGDPYANMDIARLYVYDRALSNNEMTSLYNAITETASLPSNITSFIDLSKGNICIDARDIINSSSGNKITTVGGFYQSNVSQQPTFYSTGGFNNLPYISFNCPDSQFLQTNKLTVNLASNDGFTASALVRFTDPSITPLFNPSLSVESYATGVGVGTIIPGCTVYDSSNISTNGILRFPSHKGTKYFSVANGGANRWTNINFKRNSGFLNIPTFTQNHLVVVEASFGAGFWGHGVRFGYDQNNNNIVDGNATEEGPGIFYNSQNNGIFIYAANSTNTRIDMFTTPWNKWIRFRLVFNLQDGVVSVFQKDDTVLNSVFVPVTSLTNLSLNLNWSSSTVTNPTNWDTLMLQSSSDSMAIEGLSLNVYDATTGKRVFGTNSLERVFDFGSTDLNNNIILSRSGTSGNLRFSIFNVMDNILEFPPRELSTSSNITTLTSGSYGTGTYIASASSVFNTTGYPAYLAFESTTLLNGADSFWSSIDPIYNQSTGVYAGTATTTTQSGIVYSGEWIQLELPTRIILTSFIILPRQDSSLWLTRSPGSFVVLGSNNGTTWDLIYSITGINDWTISSKTFTVSYRTSGYSIYRLVSTVAGNSSSSSLRGSIQISRLRFYGLPTVEYAINTSNSPILQNSWYNITTRYTNSTGLQELFLDNKLIGTNSSIPYLSNRTLTSNFIGRSNWNTDAYANMDLSSLYFFDKPLSYDQLTKLYAYMTSSTTDLTSLANEFSKFDSRELALSNDTLISTIGNFSQLTLANQPTYKSLNSEPVQLGLIAYFDPGDKACYSGSGATMASLVGSISATMGGTYVYNSGTIRLVNSNVSTGLNTSYLQLTSLTNITTVSLWYYQHNLNGYLLDGRNGGTGGWIYSGVGNYTSSNWTTGTLYKNGGSAASLTWANIETIGSWQNITVIANSPLTDDLTLFARTSLNEGLDVTFGPILIYNRAITESENRYNFNVIFEKYYKYNSSLITRLDSPNDPIPHISFNKTTDTILEFPSRELTSNSTSITIGSYGTGTYTASASTSLEPAYYAFESTTLFSGLDHFWHSNTVYNASTGAYTGAATTTTQSGTVYSGEWIQLQVPTQIILTSFSISPRPDSSLWLTRSPGSFVILGSNDGTTWDLIYSTSGINDWTASTKTFSVSYNKTGYTHFRLVTIVVGNSSTSTGRNSIQIARFRLFGKLSNVNSSALNITNPSSFNIETTNGFTIVSKLRVRNTNYAQEILDLSNSTTGSAVGNLTMEMTTSGNLRLSSFNTPTANDTTTAINTWTTRRSAIDNSWTGICWSPDLNLFVAVAESGSSNRVMTSSDGVIWTSRTSAADNGWNYIVWSSELSLFVAVSYSGTNNRVMTSPDGINWTARITNNNNWTQICWSPELSLFAAVSDTGSSNRVMTSSNGIEWLTRTSAADNGWHGICWSKERSLFVAVGYSGTGNRVMTSSDGITWTTRSSAADNQWFDVCWSSELGLFVAIAGTGIGNRIMTSPDGITWTTRSSPADNTWYNITWCKEIGLFISVGASGTGNRIITSSDGINWVSRTSPVDNNWLAGCWSPQLGIFIATAGSGTGNRVMTTLPIYKGSNNVSKYVNFKNTPTTAVSTWTTRKSANNSWGSVVWAAELGLFVAVAFDGTGNRVMTSPDGIDWTTRSSNANSWRNTAWSKELGLFVVVAQSGTGGRVMTSPDGINWTTRATNDNQWHSVAWSKELSLFVAVAYSGTGNRVMTSSDGVVWTTRTSAADNGWLAVTWAPEIGLFAAVAMNGTGSSRVMTSPDAVNWTTRTSATNDWRAITWSPELLLFVAVAFNGTGNRVMTSNDGITWTTRSSAVDNPWVNVTWAPELGLFVAVAWGGTGNRIMTSPDGIVWTTRTSAADNRWWGITWSAQLGIFVAVSELGTANNVMTSTNVYDYSEIKIPQNEWVTVSARYQRSAADIALDARQLDSVLINNRSVYDWGGFAQSTVSARPTYISSGGYNGRSYVSFNRTNSQFLQLPSTTLNIASGGGFTALALVRFTGTTGTNERILDYNNGIDTLNNNVVLSRDGTTSNLNFTYANNTTLYTLITTSNPIVQNEWAVFGCRYNSSTNFTELFKNAVQIASTSHAATMTDRTMASSFLGRSFSTNDTYSNIDIASLYVFDRALSDSELVNYTNNMLSTDLPLVERLDISLNGENKVTVPVISSINSRTLVSGHIGKTNNALSYSNIDIQSMYLFNRPLSNSELSEMHTYMNEPIGSPFSSNFFVKSRSKNNLENGQYTISSSSLNVTSSSPYLAFNSNIDSIEAGWSSANNLYNSTTGSYIGSVSTTVGNTVYSGEWLQVQFPSGFKLQNYSVSCRPNYETWESPRSFVIVGSNNGNSWTILDSKSNQIWNYSIKTKTYTITNPKAYIYYRFICLESGSTKYPSLLSWTTYSVPDTSSIAWSPQLSLFVAVGFSYAFTSSDGINWVTRNITTYDVRSVCWSAELSLFAAVSNPRNGKGVMTSPDGINWTSRSTNTTHNWNAICWSKELGLFVAGANGGTDNFTTMTSTNGVTWTARWNGISPENYVAWFNSIIWCTELSLFVGVHAAGGSYRILISSNGINWSWISTPNIDYSDICWSPELSLFVVVGTNGMTSSNATSWVTRNIGNTYWRSVIWIKELGLFIAGNSAGNSSKIATSPDGITWTTKSSIPINDLVWSPELNKCIGGDGSTMMCSNAYIHGDYWMLQTTIDNGWRSVTWSPQLSIFVAVSESGTGNRVMTSSDGINWTTRVSAADSSWLSITWSNELSLFVAVGMNAIMTSPDGITWASRTSPANLHWRTVIWVSQLSIFVCVAANGGSTNAVMTSPDGITWTTRTTNTNQWVSILWSSQSSLLVAVASSGTSNRVMTSPDGITWTTRSSAADNGWKDITWSSSLGLFVAVADSGTGNRIMTSSDGINWITRFNPVDNAWHSVIWAAELSQFVAVSYTGAGNRVMTSSDGITWISRTSATDNQWVYVTWSPELRLFAAVSNTGTRDRVMTSRGYSQNINAYVNKLVLSGQSNFSVANHGRQIESQLSQTGPVKFSDFYDKFYIPKDGLVLFLDPKNYYGSSTWNDSVSKREISVNNLPLFINRGKDAFISFGTQTVFDENTWYSTLTRGGTAAAVTGSNPNAQSMVSDGGSGTAGWWTSNNIQIGNYGNLILQSEVYVSPQSGYSPGDWYIYYFGDTTTNGGQGIRVLFNFWSGNLNGIGVYILKNGTTVASNTSFNPGSFINAWYPISIYYNRSATNTWNITFNGSSILTYEDSSVVSWAASAGSNFSFFSNSGGGLRMYTYIRRMKLIYNLENMTIPSVSNVTDFTVSNNYSINCWCWMASTQNDIGNIDNDIIEKVDGIDNRYPYVVRYIRSSKSIFAAVYDGTNFPSASSGSIVTNTWNFVSCTFDWSNRLISVYLNGILSGSTSLSSNIGNISNTSAVHLMQRGNNVNKVTGRLGLISIYNKSLTNTEILDTFNSTRDLYTWNCASTMAVCFSVRLIIRSYTGPIFRIRRSTDNVVSDFYTDSTQSYLTTGPGGTGTSYDTWISGATGYVTIWYDQSGNNSNATNTNNGLTQPNITVVNSKYTLQFRNSDITRLNISNIQSNTVFCHFYNSNTNAGSIISTQYDYQLRFGSGTLINGDFNAGDWYYSGTGTKLAYNNGVISNGVLVNAWNVLSCSIETPTWITSQATPGPASFTKIGADGWQGGNTVRNLDGYMTEIICHNTALTEYDLQNYYSKRFF